MANEAYKFPDELDPAKNPEPEALDIKIIDDTPPEDRGRQPMPKEIADEVENDDLEEYSDRVRLRMKQLKKLHHDERREKEQATREREEALRFAEHQLQENKQLKQRLGTGERVFKTEVLKSTAVEVAAAKEALKRAYEAADSDKIADAQEALTDAKLKLREYERFQPSLQEDSSGVQVTQQTQASNGAAPQPDTKAEAWRQKNTWFGADEEMTALALGLHEKLVRSGVDPRSDDYYRRVDETMKKRFPENFSEDISTRDREESDKTTRSAPRKTAPTVVSPATRSSAPRQVSLTPTQVALAKRLGLTNEAYARELIKLENQNG